MPERVIVEVRASGYPLGYWDHADETDPAQLTVHRVALGAQRGRQLQALHVGDEITVEIRTVRTIVGRMRRVGTTRAGLIALVIDRDDAEL